MFPPCSQATKALRVEAFVAHGGERAEQQSAALRVTSLLVIFAYVLPDCEPRQMCYVVDGVHVLQMLHFIRH